MGKNGALLPEYALLAAICAIILIAVLYSLGVGK